MQKHKNTFLFLLALLTTSICLAQKHYLNPHQNCQHLKQQNLQYQQQKTTASIATAMMTAISSAREDSLELMHYDIYLDITDFENRIIEGNCIISLMTKLEGVNEVELDLEALTVEKIEVDGEEVDFRQESPKLYVKLKETASAGQELKVNVFYAGRPQNAAFGGFYFSSNYAYNLGVGIGVAPPNYGRAWFPCFDSFSSRSLYDFHITTKDNHKAFCNGLLQDSSENEDGTATWHWKLSQTIPTYLAAVAVSDYETLESIHQGMEEPILIQLAARAADTTNLKASFIHLPNAIDAFEAAYGVHRFERVGFNVVPFGGGAMEHATNIAYPSFAVDGTLVFEDLMAHEFGHHWWGDLVTCATADDMWLNEGWASYSEQLFMEAVYGREAYLSAVTANHVEVMQYAHIRDGGHYPVSGVPFDLTYGTHVYNKGADVAHTLRGYMGDEAFFRCIKEYLSAFAFQTATSEQFRDFLGECSGFDLQNFFNDWVFNPGYPHFAVDSVVVGFDGNPFTAEVYIRQKLYGAPEFFEHVPMDITFYDTELNTYTETISLNGECDIHSFDLPFYPVMTVLDKDGKISDAMTADQQVIDALGTYDFPDGKMQVTVNQIADSSLLRIEHHWAAPDRMENAPDGVIFSPNRYWKVDGIRFNLFLASATIEYNGAATLNGGYLDNDLMTGSENALTLYHRASSADEWQEVSGLTQDIGSSTTDRRGTFTINNLQFGEYTLAFLDNNRTDPITTSIPECLVTNIQTTPFQTKNPQAYFQVFPNPMDKENLELTIRFLQSNFNSSATAKNRVLRVYHSNGSLLQSMEFEGKNEVSLSTVDWEKGVYFLQVLEDGELMGVERVLVVE